MLPQTKRSSNGRFLQSFKFDVRECRVTAGGSGPRGAVVAMAGTRTKVALRGLLTRGLGLSGHNTGSLVSRHRM